MLLSWTLSLTSHGCLTPFSEPHPITYCKNSGCVLDFPLDLHNPAHPSSPGRQGSSSLSWFVLQYGDLLMHFPTSCFSHRTRFQLYGKARSLLPHAKPLSAPRWLGWRGTKGKTADRCAQPAACTRARSRTPFGPRHRSQTGSPGQAELDHEESPGLQAAGSDSASISLAALVNPRGASPSAPCALLTPSLLPTHRPFSPPPSLGEHQEIETQAHNWKPDRFAGVNGALYTRCIKVKQTIMQPIQGGAPIYLGMRSITTHYFARFPSPLPAFRPRPRLQCCPQRTQICPLVPLVLRRGRGTTLPKMFHASVPEAPQEITGKRFLHPFLIAADYNDIFWKINT